MSGAERGNTVPPSARWRAIEQLFARALDLPAGDRDELLAAACSDDAALRREVVNLLAAHDAVIAKGGTGERFLEQLDAERAAALVEPLQVHTLQDALRDRYAVARRLGSGGMGDVFAARDLRHDRMVAIKIVRQDRVTSQLDDRFEREVRMAARLQHPHIVPLYDSGLAAGHRYYVMPLIDGPTLRQRLQQGGRLPIEEALRIVEEIADALDCAHASGIVHRDIKPENVILSGGHALVVDFGVARPVAETRASSALTGAGIAVGTPAYMSPEQAAGERIVDGRCDQYALACVAFELLTGRPPFTGETAQAVIAQHFVAPVPALDLGPGTASHALDVVMVRALAKEPAARFATTMEFASALRAARTQTLREDQATRYQSANALVADLDTLRLPVGVSARPAQRSNARAAPRAWGTWRAVSALVLVATLVAVGLLWTRTTSRRNAGPVAMSEMQGGLPSVAVLPLKNYSGDQAQDYFADGMTDELTNTLAKISALRVIAHQSVLQFKHSRQSVPEIARLLNVKHVVDGSVLQDGDRVRITATLIDAARNTPMWGERFERERRDVMALQREVALAIAQAIEIALTPQDLARLEDTAAVNPEAFDLYVRGTQARYKGLERQDIAEALRYFARAVAKDSGYAPAYAGLASAYVFSGDEARARRFVETALALDPRLAEAHVVLGLIRQTYEWDWEGSEQSFRQAIRLNPGFAEAHHELSMLLMRRRRLDEALQEAQRTLYLAPMSSRFELGLAQIYLMSGRYDEALRGSDKVLALESSRKDAYWLRALAYEQQQRYGNAEEMWSKFLALGGDADQGQSGLGRIYAVSGRRSAALQILDTLKNRWVERKGQVTSYGTAMGIAGIHASLGDRKQALDWAERAAAPGAFMLYLAIDPQLLPLHGEPRFQALLRKVGLALPNESHVRGSR